MASISNTFFEGCKIAKFVNVVYSHGYKAAVLPESVVQIQGNSPVIFLSVASKNALSVIFFKV